MTCWRPGRDPQGYLAQDELGPEHVKEIEGKTAGTIDKEGWLHSGRCSRIKTSNMLKWQLKDYSRILHFPTHYVAHLGHPGERVA